MRAAVWTAYGPPEVLQLREVETPTPRDTQVRIRVRAATVTAGDCELRRSQVKPWLWRPMRLYLGLTKPRRTVILGQELAGDVEAVGKEVDRWSEGDPVFAASGFSFGAYAEYACLPANGIVAPKPTNLTYEEAAAVPLGGLEAMNFVRRGNVRDGEEVLINGAGGTIGTFAVQLAKDMGAIVTAVDGAAKLDMLRSIGADRVIDYAQEDFSRTGRAYDVIFDVVGKSSFSRSLRALKDGGRYLLGNPRLSQIIRGRAAGVSGKKVIPWEANDRADDLIRLKELIEAGRVKPVLDRVYPLEDIVEAHRYVESGRKRGNVAVSLAPDEDRDV